MTVSDLSAVFLSTYDFTGISSVLGIIVILKKNKTIPNQTLSWRNGMMVLFSSNTVLFYISPTVLLKCDIVQIDETTNAEKYRQVLINYVIPSGKHLIGNGLNVFQYHNDPKHTVNASEIIFGEKNNW